MLLLICLSVTYQVWHQSREQESLKLEAEFELKSQQVVNELEQYLAVQDRMLRGVQSLFKASNSVEEEEFLAYTDSLKNLDNHQGLLCVAFAGIQPVQAPLSAAGKVAIHALDIEKRHIPVMYSQPFSGSDACIRQDIKLPEGRFKAFRQAMVNADTYLTQPIMRQNRASNIATLDMILPVYSNRMHDQSVEARTQHIQGWVFSSFDIATLMREIFQQEASQLRIRITDISEPQATLPVYETPGINKRRTPRYSSIRHLQIHGRMWSIQIASRAAFETALDHHRSNLVAGAGLVVSVLLYLLSRLFAYRTQTLHTMRAMHKDLILSEQRWKFALEGSGDGIWDWDIENNQVIRSARWKSMLGLEDWEMGPELDAWKKRIHPEDVTRVISDLEKYMNGETPQYINEHRLLCKDGSWKWILARGMVVDWAADGRPLRMVGTHTDISRLKESENLVWKQANFDQLTELPNRRMFYDRLAQEIKKSNRLNLPLALLFLDLDHFKEVNDTLGHDKGDQLLQEAARRINQCVRNTDTVARLGGDEFIVILSELDDLNSIGRIAQDILGKLSTSFKLGEDIAFVSASMGITLYPTDASSIDDLLKNVDQAMYSAKASGRNRISYFTPSMQQAAHQKMLITNDLRMALQQHQLQVHYQPIIHLASGTIQKAEALLRWQHPQRGMVSPAEFIPIAEETGLIMEIGDWVFEQSMLQVKKWQQQRGAHFQISVNKSPVQFKNDSSTHDHWLDYMKQLGLVGQSLVVEITEGLLLDTSQNVTKKLLAFRDAGIQVALDDFGTGYSSLAYLRRFDIDYIKIDQSFVRNISTQPDDLALCESIIAMAHKLGLNVIAEGIETEEQCALLKAAGCDYGQGYWFSPAVPAEKFETLTF
ncbi:MAG TPA: EAL domain-containing protein [Methylovorus sp.]|nr:EAL domain-containing protein [Methylovorus sp.]